jgi:hypothetical protein
MNGERSRNGTLSIYGNRTIPSPRAKFVQSPAQTQKRFTRHRRVAPKSNAEVLRHLKAESRNHSDFILAAQKCAEVYHFAGEKAG